ncbi:MAG: hypothetical protein ABIO81_09625 [Ginsengibacter sp.]
MENNLNKHKFLEFAEQQLEKHIAELNTNYKDRTMPADDEKDKAIERHLNMFTAELEEKSKELNEEENSKQIIKEYQEKFKNSLP